jgi:hypothetical protein
MGNEFRLAEKWGNILLTKIYLIVAIVSEKHQKPYEQDKDLLCTSGVNFINVMCTAFTLINPKSLKHKQVIRSQSYKSLN